MVLTGGTIPTRPVIEGEYGRAVALPGILLPKRVGSSPTCGAVILNKLTKAIGEGGLGFFVNCDVVSLLRFHPRVSR
jgi:hypothetical protein